MFTAAGASDPNAGPGAADNRALSSKPGWIQPTGSCRIAQQSCGSLK